MYFDAEAIAVSKDILVAFTAIISMIAVIAGYNAWQREHVGKTKYELARRLIRAAKHVQLVFAQIRAPVQFIKRKVDDQFTTDPISCFVERHKNPADYQYKIHSKNLKFLADVMAVLDAEVLEAEVLGWSSELTKARNQLHHCASKLSWAYNDQIIQLASRSSGPEQVQKRKEFGPIIASTSDDADTNSFTRDIDNAVATIERVLVPYLKRKHNFSWRKNR